MIKKDHGSLPVLLSAAQLEKVWQRSQKDGPQCGILEGFQANDPDGTFLVVVRIRSMVLEFLKAAPQQVQQQRTEGLDLLGWFYCGDDCKLQLSTENKEFQAACFAGREQIILLMDPVNGLAGVRGGDNFSLRGFYLYEPGPDFGRLDPEWQISQHFTHPDGRRWHYTTQSVRHRAQAIQELTAERHAPSRVSQPDRNVLAEDDEPAEPQSEGESPVAELVEFLRREYEVVLEPASAKDVVLTVKRNENQVVMNQPPFDVQVTIDPENPDQRPTIQCGKRVLIDHAFWWDEDNTKTLYHGVQRLAKYVKKYLVDLGF